MQKKPSFEDKLERLTAINEALEEGGVDLATSIALFKEGTALVGQLTEMLSAAELEISQITTAPEDDENGA
jgi:exodeoxyribonuclease VII small subunit